MSIYDFAVQEILQGHKVCLATIINQIGSSPRGMGTNFLVRDDGEIRGTIGGGKLEAEAIKAALKAMRTETCDLLHIRLKGEDVAQSEMICGGDVDIYLEPISANDKNSLSVYETAAKIKRKGGRSLLITPITPGRSLDEPGGKLLLRLGKSPKGKIAQAPDLAEDLAPQFDEFCDAGRVSIWMKPLGSGGKLDCLIEPVIGTPVVYLFGGGHVSLQIARLVRMAGFNLVVAEDRPEFAGTDRFPEADAIWVEDYPEMLAGKDLGDQAYAVIVTRGHLFDKDVLAQVLKRKTIYVGMIGSRRKRDMIFQALLDEGVPKQDIARVHSPIGLDIGADTPEEIAISIVAELIAARAGKDTGLSLRQAVPANI